MPLKKGRVLLLGSQIQLSAEEINCIKPLNRNNAEMLLRAAGIEYERVVATAVAEKEALIDRETGRGYKGQNKGQTVIAEIAAQDGQGKKTETRTVHLVFLPLKGKIILCSARVEIDGLIKPKKNCEKLGST